MANRRAARVDDNQPGIVKELRRLGISVEPGHDDLIVGYRGMTYWYEIKNPARAKSKKTGKLLESSRKDSQRRLDREFTGHRKTVFSVGEILVDIGYSDNLHL